MWNRTLISPQLGPESRAQVSDGIPSSTTSCMTSLGKVPTRVYLYLFPLSGGAKTQRDNIHNSMDHLDIVPMALTSDSKPAPMEAGSWPDPSWTSYVSHNDPLAGSAPIGERCLNGSRPSLLSCRIWPRWTKNIALDCPVERWRYCIGSHWGSKDLSGMNAHFFFAKRASVQVFKFQTSRQHGAR